MVLENSNSHGGAEPTTQPRATPPNYSIKVICGEHRRAVASVKFSPNGSLLASASADGSVKIWHVPSGTNACTLTGHAQGISDVCWTADSRYVATASDDKLIKIWDVQAEMEVCSLEGHENYVFCVNFNNPRSDLLVSGSFDEHVKLWDVRHNKCLRTLMAHSDPVTGTDFSRDGTCVVSSSHDGLIRMWDTGTGECLKTIFAEGNPSVSFVRYSPNSRYILAGTLDDTLRLWNTSNPSKCVKTYEGHCNSKFSMSSAFLVTAGQWICSGSEDNRIYIWDLQSKKVMQRLEGHTDAVLAVSEHPTQSLLASGAMTRDRSVRIWEHCDSDSMDPSSGQQ